MKGEDVQNNPGPIPNFGWPQNAKLGLELVLACSDLKLEDVRFISQCLGGWKTWRHLDRVQKKTRETSTDETPDGMTWAWVKSLTPWSSLEPKHSRSLLFSNSLPHSICQTSPLGLICHASEIFFSPLRYLGESLFPTPHVLSEFRIPGFLFTFLLAVSPPEWAAHNLPWLLKKKKKSLDTTNWFVNQC